MIGCHMPQWAVRDFGLQFAGGLGHFRARLPVEGSADERSSVHQLGEVDSLRAEQKVKGHS